MIKLPIKKDIFAPVVPRYQKIDVIASSTSATVVLSSDQSKSLAGFRATYQAVENIDRHVGNTI